MARRRRPGSRTSVADGRAELVVPVDAFETADGEGLPFAAAKNWLASVSGHPAVLSDARPAVALVVDGFAYDLHLGDLAFASDTHDGESFRDVAVSSGVDVYITTDLDPRRSDSDALRAAAQNGQVLGAHVMAYGVDQLSE